MTTALLTPATAIALRPPPSPGAYVVLPPDPPVRTSFTSVRDRWYRITVSGTYLYDGRFGRSDCGHRDPITHGAWGNEPNFTIDGKSVGCVFMPFSNTHTYEWLQRGTGAPFTLNVPDGSYNTDDDLGPLLVVFQDVKP